MPSVYLSGTSLPIPTFYTTAEPLLGLLTGPTDYANISEIIVNCVSSNHAINVPTLYVMAIGDTGTYRKSSLAQMARGDGGSSDMLPGIFLVNQWTVKPTLPTSYLRRFIGTYAGTTTRTMTFPRGLKLAPSTALILWFESSQYNVNQKQTRVELNFSVDA